MKIAFCLDGRNRGEKTVKALELVGQEVICFKRQITDYNYDIGYMDELVDFCEREYIEQVWSMDFCPIIARGCHCLHIPYVSWITEERAYTLYSEAADYKENYMFVAEESIYEQVKGIVPGHIFYMMPGGIQQYIEPEDRVIWHLPKDAGSGYQMKKECSQYLLGYLRGMVEVQRILYGCSLSEMILNENIEKEFDENIQRTGLGSDYRTEPLKCRINDFLCDTMLELEKEKIQKKMDTGVSIEEDLRKIGKINISISNRKWKKGLPFEAFNIMLMGGFLITNYQEALEEYFEIGKELVVFEDDEDLNRKILYYMEHEEERQSIANAGREAVERQYLLVERIKDMLYILEQVL